MKIIITGATGTVGSAVLRQAIRDKGIEKITALVRSPMPLSDAKVTTVLHRDFFDYSPLFDVFREHDACVWCLGISQTQVSREDYMSITYYFTIAAAKAMLQANPNTSFVFVSGEGADSSERSRIRFARIKGKTENELRKLPFKKLIIVRPAGIVPADASRHTTFYKKFELLAVRIMQRLTPGATITADHLARVMLFLLQNPTDRIIFGNKLLRAIAPPEQ